MKTPAIAQQTARKEIEIETINAEIARTEKEAERSEKEVLVETAQLEATIKKKAEADRYAQQQKADAEKYERQARAEAEAFEKKQASDAEVYRLTQLAIAQNKEAEGILAVGRARAEVIELEAKAQNTFDEKALQMEMLKVLPEVVRAVSEPLSKTEKIVMFGDGNVEKMMKDTIAGSMSLFERLQQSTGLNLSNIINTFVGTKAAIQSESIENTPAITHNELNEDPVSE